GIYGHLKYRSDLFERSTIEHLIENWRRFLRAAITNPDETIYSLLLALDRSGGSNLQISGTQSPLRPAPAPFNSTRDSGPAPAPPRTELEQKLARIWESVFDLHPI